MRAENGGARELRLLGRIARQPLDRSSRGNGRSDADSRSLRVHARIEGGRPRACNLPRALAALSLGGRRTDFRRVTCNVIPKCILQTYIFREVSRTAKGARRAPRKGERGTTRVIARGPRDVTLRCSAGISAALLLCPGETCLLRHRQGGNHIMRWSSFCFYMHMPHSPHSLIGGSLYE
jgi:hypothetical protein